MDNTFLLLKGINKLDLVTQPVPELGPNGLGHEASGVVAKCGQKVTHLKLGDRVCIEPGNPCRSCKMCYNGKYNVCDQSSFYNNVTLYPGCIAKYFINKADLTFKLPDNVTDEEGAMIEPLAVAIHSCRRAGVNFGSSILITGAGPIGLLCLIAAKAMGATNIVVTDIKANRLEVAKKLGATHTLMVGGQVGEAKDEAKRVTGAMEGAPEITLECSGSPSGMSLGIYATKPRGVVVAVGLLPAEIKLPLGCAMVKEMDIRGIYRFVDCFPAAIEMVALGLVDLKPLVTHRFKFEEYQKAFDMFHTGQDGAIKCMISCQ